MTPAQTVAKNCLCPGSSLPALDSSIAQMTVVMQELTRVDESPEGCSAIPNREWGGKRKDMVLRHTRWLLAFEPQAISQIRAPTVVRSSVTSSARPQGGLGGVATYCYSAEAKEMGAMFSKSPHPLQAESLTRHDPQISIHHVTPAPLKLLSPAVKGGGA